MNQQQKNIFTQFWTWIKWNEMTMNRIWSDSGSYYTKDCKMCVFCWCINMKTFISVFFLYLQWFLSFQIVYLLLESMPMLTKNKMYFTSFLSVSVLNKKKICSKNTKCIHTAIYENYIKKTRIYLTENGNDLYFFRTPANVCVFIYASWVLVWYMVYKKWN